MNKIKVAGELVRLAKTLIGKETRAIGGVDFEAIRKTNARGQKYWVYKVGRKEFEQSYATTPKMWDDLERSYKAVGDDGRWKKSFK